MNTHKSSDALNPTAPPVDFAFPQPLAIPQPSIPVTVSVQPLRSSSMPIGKAEWSNDLCDCFDDCSEFCCACFCTLCYQFDTLIATTNQASDNQASDNQVNNRAFNSFNSK